MLSYSFNLPFLLLSLGLLQSLETDVHMKPIDCRKVREALSALLDGVEREAAAIKAAEKAAVD